MIMMLSDIPILKMLAIGVAYMLSIWLATVSFYIGLACLIGTMVTFLVMLRMEVMGRENAT